ncbi:MAG TPA: di-heme oxidoredictase family protein, partial [Polyangia bacterium]
LFIRSSCAACHRDDGRGPGLVGRMVVVDGDGRRSADQSRLRFGDTERPYATAGATEPLLPPRDPAVRINHRLPPAVFGRGYLEAVADDEIERLAREAAARSNGIRGRIHWVGEGAGKKAIGRFGLKARTATLDGFTADAFQGDMGLTSPMRPRELPNPEHLSDDARAGVDLEQETIDLVADYVRLLEIPARRHRADKGTALFAQASCATCHTPTLRTRRDYPIAALAGIEAPVYTDLLLHDMGDALADGVVEGQAGARDWRTAPLIGMRFASGLMHDGRARTVADAIAAHAGPGSEANGSVAAFEALAPDDRRILIQFVEGL